MTMTINTLLREAIREILCENAVVDDSTSHEKGDEFTLASDDPQLDQVIDSLIDMVKLSYSFMGGWSEIETPAGLKSKFTHFYLSDVDEDPEPDAGIFYTNWSGSRKASVIATDGGSQSKSKIREMMTKFFSTPGSWAEVSGAPANIMIAKLGLPTVETEEEVRALLQRLPQEDIEFRGMHPDPSVSYGEGWYARTIGGKRVTKIIVGNP